MSFSLTANFWGNARGITFADGGGVVWSFNKNTNTLTASAAGGLTGAGNPTAKVGLAAVNGVASTYMASDSAPPIDQAIVPTWTGLHTFTAGATFSGTFTLDTFTLSLTGNASLSGTNTGDQVVPAAANPTAKVALAAVNGAATSFMRSDAAPALDVTIAPSWTGIHTWAGPAATDNVQKVNAVAGHTAAFDFAGNALASGTTSFIIGQDGSGVAQILQRNNAAMNLWTNGVLRIAIAATGGVTVNPATSGVSLTIGAGSATVTPAVLSSGALNTTPVAGALEYDGTALYFSPAASDRAVNLTEYVQVMSGTHTLVSQTGAQQLLNGSAAGLITLPVGTYEFECDFTLSSMSASSGSFGFALGGTATFTQSWTAMATKSTTSLATANTPSMTFNTAANTTLVAANTNTVAACTIRGIIRVTVAGTVVPQVSLGVAAAAVVGANSNARFRVIGSATVQTVGNWS